MGISQIIGFPQYINLNEVPLHQPRNGHLEVVRCLSDAGAQDEKPDECPQCSFWLSAMLCTAEAAGMLSTAGASLGLSCVIAQMMRWKLFSGA